jgi:plastocyanin
LKLVLIAVTLFVLVPLAVIGCGGSDNNNGSSNSSTGSTGSTGSSASGNGGTVQLGSTTLNDHGTKDISSDSSVDLEADNFYFEPTFLKGKPGQTVTVKVENESNALHNLSVKSLNIDKDLAAGSDTEVQITFPQSGVLLFFCKYHAGQGMNGELLTGDASPQAPAS